MSEELDPADLPVGTRVGDFEVVQRVGAGGQGALYEVTRKGRSFALKLSCLKHEELSASEREDMEARTRREVGTLLMTQHPNVVRVVEFGRWPDVDTGYLYLVMDFIKGRRLLDWQSQTTPSLRAIATVFITLADALDELHRHGIIHRDIKSQNVMVREDGQPILIDFGIARTRSAHTLTAVATIIGTSTHLSCDYARHIVEFRAEKGEPYVTKPNDDLHAVGFMLYEMLSGIPPFRLETNQWELLTQIARAVPPPPRVLNPRVPEALDAVVVKLLAKEPQDRFESAASLRAALEAALATADSSWDVPFESPPPATARAAARRGPTPAPQKPAAPGIQDLLLDEVPQKALESPPAPPQPSPAARSPAPAGPPVQPSEPAPSFEAPTSRGFIPPEAPRVPAPAAPLPVRPELPTVLRQARAELTTHPLDRRHWLSFAAAVIGLLAAITFALRSVVAPPRPQSLLDTSTTTSATPSLSSTQAALPPVQAPDHPPSQTAAAPHPMPANVSPGPAAGSAPPTVARQPETTRHPTTPAIRPPAPPPASSPTPTTGAPSWLKGAVVTDAAEPAAPTAGSRVNKKYGVPFGTHMKMKLKSNLDSRTISSGIVEATLTRPLVVRGEIVLPSYTMAYGTAQATADRFLVRFTRLRLPDDTSVEFKGSALDSQDGKPGLAVTRRISGPAAAQPDIAGNVAKGTANALLSRAGGNTVGELVGSAGRQIINQNPTENEGQVREAVLLDAGATFEIVVEEPF